VIELGFPVKTPDGLRVLRGADYEVFAALHNLRVARFCAVLWMIGGLGLAGVGVATFAHAESHGGYVWTGAIVVGALIAWRALLTIGRATSRRRAIVRAVRADGKTDPRRQRLA
jgi:hypothetical protein